MHDRIQAAIFDLDGLLIDSEPIQIDAWHRFLEGYGHRLQPDVLGRLFGLRIWDTARLVIEIFKLPLSVDQVVAERDAIFFSMLEHSILPMPYAQETVEALRGRGLRTGLATSGHREYADIALAGLGLVGAFDVEVTGGEVVYGKPSPDIYLLAAAKLAVPPEACLALEDAPHGVAAAKGAGMRCLAVPNAMTRSLPGLQAADAVLASLGDVLPWLESHGLLPSFTDNSHGCEAALDC